MKIAEFVKEMRKRYNLTQVDLSEKSGVGLRFVRELEQGKETLRSSSTITKYNANDGKTVLDPEDDAATVILGENYRMPTVEEGNELIEQCTWSWTTYNNVAGYKITGPNGNYIFLPAVGYKGSTNPYYPAGEYGLYWLANIDESHYARLFSLKHNILPTGVAKLGTRCYGFAIRPVYDDSISDSDSKVRNCYTFTQEHWDAATSLWGHSGRGHAPSDQSCIQGTIVYGVRLKVAQIGSLNVYKVPSLTEKTEDNFELVATLTTDSTGVQDFDFPQPVYVGPNEYLVFGKPSEEMPTLFPCYIAKPTITFPAGSQGFAHFIGSEKAANRPYIQGVLMVEFY